MANNKSVLHHFYCYVGLIAHCINYQSMCSYKIYSVLFVLSWAVLVPNYAVSVVFRYDDFTLNPCETDKAVVDLFNDLRVPLSIAVIPCDSSEQVITPKDSSIIEKLRNDNIEIALHGLTHQNIQQMGEFGALTREETMYRIQKGKQILESISGKTIHTFIPPYNAINQYVPSVLQENGIYILSADKYSRSCGDIQFYPETLGLLMKRFGIWNAAQATILQFTGDRTICVVMFHHYDLQTKEDWQQLEYLLRMCKDSPNVHLHTFYSLYANGQYSNSIRIYANQLESELKKHVLQQGILYPTWICLLVHFLNALLYALISLPFFCIVCKKTTSHKRYIIIAIYTLVYCCSFSMAWWHILGPRKLLLLLLLSNTILSVLLLIAIHRKML